MKWCIKDTAAGLQLIVTAQSEHGQQRIKMFADRSLSRGCNLTQVNKNHDCSFTLTPCDPLASIVNSSLHVGACGDTEHCQLKTFAIQALRTRGCRVEFLPKEGPFFAVRIVPKGGLPDTYYLGSKEAVA
jgi:hypothetical protein